MNETLNPRHAEILRRMVDTAHGELVSGTTDDDYTAPAATLRAMERRGLVEISTRREGDGWAGPKTVYRFARITDAGRAAVKVEREPVAPDVWVVRVDNHDNQNVMSVHSTYEAAVVACTEYRARDKASDYTVDEFTMDETV